MNRSAPPAPTRLRGHHFLCLYGFRGLGYSQEFVNNMNAVLQAILREPAQMVQPVDVADDICQACPHLQDGRCAKRGEQSDTRVREHDRTVLRRLGIKPGHALPASQVFAAVERHISAEDLPSLCERCQWLPLGWCQEGMRGRRMPGAQAQQTDSRGQR